MGHGIEQAITRFVRSTSVTLKVLNSHDSDVLWRVQMLVQRQCIRELAIMKGRSNNGRVILCYSSSKSKYKKSKNKNKNSISTEPALNKNVFDSLGKEVRLLLLKEKGGLYRPHQV